MTGVLDVAWEHRIPVPLDTLVELLPEYGPVSADEMAGWIRDHPSAGRAWGRWAVPPQIPENLPDRTRRLRGEQYLRAAGELLDSELKATQGWLCFLGVTGSTAYGDPEPGDDCDLMAIVRPGAVWVFLTYVFLRMRLRRTPVAGPGDPEWCFNYTLDEGAAIQEFSRPRGFLFAREALVTRPVRGDAYYRGLLRRGEWLRHEAPRLFARWESTGLPDPTSSLPAPPVVRWLNAMLFPLVAAYLQLKGLRANSHLRTAGRTAEAFRTITRLDRMALATSKFERLTDRMSRASRLAPE